MPLTMTRSIQLELAIDDATTPKAFAPAHPRRPQRPQRRTPATHPQPRRTRIRGGALGLSCGECGGPLVDGEGARTCVICGKRWRNLTG